MGTVPNKNFTKSLIADFVPRVLATNRVTREADIFSSDPVLPYGVNSWNTPSLWLATHRPYMDHQSDLSDEPRSSSGIHPRCRGWCGRGLRPGRGCSLPVSTR